jgi:hypothetical protein
MLTLVRLVIVLILMQIGARFAPNVLLVLKSFWMHPVELVGDKGLVECRFGPFRGT